MPEALIWGASGGIGKALVNLLKAQDWRVYAAARNTGRVPADADLICTFDARSEYSVKDAIFRIAQETTALDLIVYAAGAVTGNPLEKLEQSAWDNVIASNLTGAYTTAREGLNLLRESGHMFFIGAYVEHITLPRMGAYAAAKAAMEPFVTILRKENRKHKFTLVHPGAVDTAFWEHAPFKLPGNAKQPPVVAEAIMEHYDSGLNTNLDL